MRRALAEPAVAQAAFPPRGRPRVGGRGRPQGIAYAHQRKGLVSANERRGGPG
jgi:hypothetical protein